MQYYTQEEKGLMVDCVRPGDVSYELVFLAELCACVCNVAVNW
jgi:hypothetical protein